MFDWVLNMPLFTPILAEKEVNGKINSLRTFYCNKLNKFSDSEKSGAGLDDTYESKWSHFFETNLISLVQTNLIV